MLRVHLCVLALAAGCRARPEQPVRAPESSPQIRAATPVVRGFAPLPAAIEGFPPALDDVALMHMYEYGEGFPFRAFFEEDDGLRLRPPACARASPRHRTKHRSTRAST